MNKHTLSLSFAAVAVVFMTGCGTLHQHLQASRFDTPETNGTQRRFKFHGSAVQSHDYTAVNDTSARPPDTTHPTTEDITTVGFDFSGGLIDNLDIGLKAGGPSMFTVKFQLAGPSQTTAKAGDSSLAIMGGIGTGSEASTDTSITLGTQSWSWSGSMKTKTLDAAIIAGTRLSDRVLLYGGVFYTDYKFDGHVDQSATADGSQTAASYSFQNGGTQRGANLGLQIFLGASPCYLMVEGVYGHLRALSLDHELYRVGYAFGASF